MSTLGDGGVICGLASRKVVMSPKCVWDPESAVASIYPDEAVSHVCLSIYPDEEAAVALVLRGYGWALSRKVVMSLKR